MKQSPPAGALAVRASLALALALASISCGSSSSAPSDAGASSDVTVAGATALPCDVNAVVVAKCQACHSNPPNSGAPMPLVTWEDFQAATRADPLGPKVTPGARVYQTAETRIHSTTSPMPQVGAQPLTTAEMATMDTWLNAGAPKTDTASCVGLGDASAPDGSVPQVTCNTNNVKIEATSPWTMPQTTQDEYVCYSVTIPPAGGGTNHIMAITPNVDNHKIVHHILLFQADPNDASITSTPAPCNAGGSLTWRIVYGWAPGGTPMQTPPNVGFPYDATTKWVVQVHYNNINGLSGETDKSGFAFCSTDQPVQYDADVVAFGTMNFKIPANAALDTTCSFTVPSQLAGAHVFAAFPHMHQLGQAIQTEQLLPGGGIVGMAENTPWNFNTQLWFPIDTTLHLGDVVKTRCAWMNTTPADVTFGQNTENEMCYSFTAYYPRITSSFSWTTPSLGSSCVPSSSGGLPAPDAGWTSGGTFGNYADGGTD